MYNKKFINKPNHIPVMPPPNANSILNGGMVPYYRQNSIPRNPVMPPCIGIQQQDPHTTLVYGIPSQSQLNHNE